jgi:hypothetical protein
VRLDAGPNTLEEAIVETVVVLRILATYRRHKLGAAVIR